MRIREFVRPSDINEAYEKLVETKGAVVIGGGAYLRLQKRTLPLVVDVSRLGLEGIEVGGEYAMIGAMTSLRAIETNEALPECLRNAMRGIAGVAVRNIATIGGSVMGRYPFSDCITALLSLEAELEFHRSGKMMLSAFITEGSKGIDILKSIKIKLPKNSTYHSYRKVYTDFPILTLSVAKHEKFIISIGARPALAKAMPFDNLNDISSVVDHFEFGDDLKASGEYRKALAKALLEDIYEEVKAWK